MSPDESERLLKIIESSAKHGAALVRQLLAFARGAEGQHTGTRKLRDLLDDFASFIRPTLPSNVVFVTEFRSGYSSGEGGLDADEAYRC